MCFEAHMPVACGAVQTGICAALNKLLQEGGDQDTIESAAQDILHTLQEQCKHVWVSDTAAVPRLQPFLALCAKNASTGAASSQTAHLVRSELINLLTHSMMTTASDQPLSPAQAQVHATLAACAGPPCEGHPLSADLARKVVSSAVSRTLCSSEEVGSDNTDVVAVRVLLSSGLVGLPCIAQQLLCELLSSAESKHAATVLMTPHHTISSFVEACTSVQQSVAAGTMARACEMLTLLLEQVSAGQLSADSDGAFETLFLLCFGTVLQSAHDGCARLLASSAVPRLQHSANFAHAKGLLYMATVTLQAAVEAPSDATCQAASRVMPCTVLCLCAECSQAEDAAASAAVQAFKAKALPLMFELSLPILVDASKVSKLPATERLLREEAADVWRASRCLVVTCAPTDVAALIPVLMRNLLDNWDAEQARSPVRAVDAEGAQQQACSGAARYAPEAVELLQLAHAAGTSVQCTVLHTLRAAAFTAAKQDNPVTEPDDSSGAAVQHMVLLLCAVLLRINDAELLESALSSSVQKHAVEIATVQLSGDMEPDCSLLTALLQHAADTLPSEKSVLISRLLRQLWDELQADRASGRGHLCLTALVTVSSLPHTAVTAVGEFFTDVAAEAAEELCKGDPVPAANTCQIVTAAAAQVQACAVTRGSVATSRDSLAMTVLAWLCQRPPVLSRDEAKDVCTDSSAEASAMAAVASLFIPRPLQASASGARSDPHMASIRLLAGANGVDSAVEAEQPDTEQQETAQQDMMHHGSSVSRAVHENGSEDSETTAADVDQVQQLFSDAVAHQLRGMHRPGAYAACSLQETEQDALQQFFFAAHSMASAVLSSTTLERLQRYLYGCVFAATLAIEHHCEAMCSALLDATRGMAGLAGNVDPKECAEIALQLSWSKPAIVGARLLVGVQQAVEENMPQAAGLHPVMFELFCDLCRKCSASKGCIERSEVLADVDRLAVRLLLCYGACMHIARLLQEDSCRVEWDAWVPGSPHFWHSVAQAALLHVSDSSIDKAVQEFDLFAETELGVPAVQAAVGVLQCDVGSACMHAAASRIALHPSVLINVVKQNIAEYDTSAAISVRALLPFAGVLLAVVLWQRDQCSM